MKEVTEMKLNLLIHCLTNEENLFMAHHEFRNILFDAIPDEWSKYPIDAQTRQLVREKVIPILKENGWVAKQVKAEIKLAREARLKICRRVHRFIDDALNKGYVSEYGGYTIGKDKDSGLILVCKEDTDEAYFFISNSSCAEFLALNLITKRGNKT